MGEKKTPGWPLTLEGLKPLTSGPDRTARRFAYFGGNVREEVRLILERLHRAVCDAAADLRSVPGVSADAIHLCLSESVYEGAMTVSVRAEIGAAAGPAADQPTVIDEGRAS